MDDTPLHIFKVGTAALRLYEREVEVAQGGIFKATRQRVPYEQIARVRRS